MFRRSESYITQYTPQGVYGQIVNENNEVNISLMIVKIILCPYQDSTRHIPSNITLCLQEFPRASPSGTPSDKGLYLTVYHSSCLNTDTGCRVQVQDLWLVLGCQVLPQFPHGAENLLTHVTGVTLELITCPHLAQRWCRLCPGLPWPWRHLLVTKLEPDYGGGFLQDLYSGTVRDAGTTKLDLLFQLIIMYHK